MKEKKLLFIKIVRALGKRHDKHDLVLYVLNLSPTELNLDPSKMNKINHQPSSEISSNDNSSHRTSGSVPM